VEASRSPAPRSFCHPAHEMLCSAPCLCAPPRVPPCLHLQRLLHPAPSRPAAAVQGCPPRAAPRPAEPVATRPGARRCGWPRTGPRPAVPNPTPNPAGGAQVRLAAQRQHALLEELQLALTQRAWLGPRPAASAAPAAAAGGRLAPQARPCCSAIAPDVRMCACQAMLPRMLGSFCPGMPPTHAAPGGSLHSLALASSLPRERRPPRVSATWARAAEPGWPARARLAGRALSSGGPTFGGGRLSSRAPARRPLTSTRRCARGWRRSWTRCSWRSCAPWASRARTRSTRSPPPAAQVP